MAVNHLVSLRRLRYPDRQGEPYDDPAYAKELGDMCRSAEDAFLKVSPVIARAWDLIAPFGPLVDPLRAEIFEVEDAVRKADVLTLAATAGTADLPDDAVRIQAEMWCKAMSDLREALENRVADWSGCVKESAVIAWATRDCELPHK